MTNSKETSKLLCGHTEKERAEGWCGQSCAVLVTAVPTTTPLPPARDLVHMIMGSLSNGCVLVIASILQYKHTEHCDAAVRAIEERDRSVRDAASGDVHVLAHEPWCGLSADEAHAMGARSWWWNFGIGVEAVGCRKECNANRTSNVTPPRPVREIAREVAHQLLAGIHHCTADRHGEVCTKTTDAIERLLVTDRIARGGSP